MQLFVIEAIVFFTVGSFFCVGTADCAYTFQSPPGTVMTMTVHDLRVTSTSYYSQPYGGYGVPPPTSNDCNAEAVRIYDYQQDGSLVVVST